MTIFVDTSILVAVTLGGEPLSAKAKKALEELEDEDPAVDTTIMLEVFLVLKSKVGVKAAATEVGRILRSYAYLTVTKAVIVRALAVVNGSRIGDAAIVEHARSLRAGLLTLDEKQAGLLGERARLVR